MIRLIVFDMDGVLFEGKNFWLDVHRALGTEREGREYAERYLRTDYDQLVSLVMALWHGRPAAPYLELVRTRRYEVAVAATIGQLPAHVATAIVSTGSLDLARRAQVELGIEAVYANELVLDNDYISSTFRITVRDNGKADVLRTLAASRGLSTSEVMFVGDGENDVEPALAAGLAVAYDPASERLVEACDHVLERGQFSQIATLLKAAD